MIVYMYLYYNSNDYIHTCLVPRFLHFITVNVNLIEQNWRQQGKIIIMNAVKENREPGN